MKSALIFGGTGQVGRAVALALVDAGWTVTAVTRSGRRLPGELTSRGVAEVPGNQRRAEVIAAAQRRFDAIIDATAYDESDARDLLNARSHVGALVVLSSSSVYLDPAGRSLDEAAVTGFPEFPTPITEDTPTVAPGPQTYSTRKVAMERALRGATIPVTILRPCAVYGTGARHFREWWFIRRALDRRKAIPLAFDGLSRFHTSSVAALARLVEIVLRNPTSMTLNVADPEAITVAEIAKAIETAIAMPLPIAPFPGPPPKPSLVGSSPWSAALPFVLDTSRARALGWDGGAGYPRDVIAPCTWALQYTRDGNGDALFDETTRYYKNLGDYQSEDQFLRRQFS